MLQVVKEKSMREIYGNRAPIFSLDQGGWSANSLIYYSYIYHKMAKIAI